MYTSICCKKMKLTIIIMICIFHESCNVSNLETLQKQQEFSIDMFNIFLHTDSIKIDVENNKYGMIRIYENSFLVDSSYLECKAYFLANNLNDYEIETEQVEILLYNKSVLSYREIIPLSDIDNLVAKDSLFNEIMKIVFKRIDHQSYFNIDSSLETLSKYKQFKGQFTGFIDLLKGYSQKCKRVKYSQEYKNLKTGYQLLQGAGTIDFWNQVEKNEIENEIREDLNYILEFCGDVKFNTTDSLIIKDGIVVQ